MTWIFFLATTAVVFITGSNLSRYGDVIADKSGWGRTWVGVILVASVTSLPELITGTSAVVIYDGLKDIAIGNVLGSCLFNLAILVLLDAICGKTALSTRASAGHALGAGFGVFLLGVVCCSLVVGDRLPAVGWIGSYSIALVAIYVLSVRVIFRYERWRFRVLGQEEPGASDTRTSLRKAVWLYALNSAVVVAAACYLPSLGEQISAETGLSKSFVGNVFIALVTSLPELVVCVAAVRIGAIDIAYGNVLGSNLFNILILAIEDGFYAAGPILNGATVVHLYVAGGTLLMNAIIIITLTQPRPKRKIVMAWDSWALLLIYAAVFVLISLPQTR